MPFGDGTGPLGRGPMTGRRAGYCAGYGVPGYMNRGFGRGYGWGRGRWGGAGPAWDYAPGWAAPAPLSREQEVDLLKAQAKDLENALQRINDRLDALQQES
ncbi:MAG: DUF5320 domain-containing protein [Chloroflexi bacterium]|nr:DUF5320 domain-containing protein [Chloroflexota bacterium]